MWEDEQNKSGGKWILKLKKGVSDRMWENLIIATVSDQLPEGICGAVLSVRQNEDIISVWNNDAHNQLKIDELKYGSFLFFITMLTIPGKH